MKKLAISLVLACVVVGIVFGCGRVEDKVVVRVTDNEGLLETREVAVGYVNERMEKMPPMLLPGVPGHEGKLEFIEEIVRKELLVVSGLRKGVDEDPRLAIALTHFENKKAKDMLTAELVTGPSEHSQRELEEYYEVRDTQFQRQEIVVQTEEEAAEAYRRVTEGGEDFGLVAEEMSKASSAAEQGMKMSEAWQDLHPLMRVAIRDLHRDDVSEPLQIGMGYYIFKVLSRKTPAEKKPLEGDHLTAVADEARRFKGALIEKELTDKWVSEASITVNDEALETASARIDEAVDRLVPKDEAETREEAVARMHIEIVPEFTEEETGTEFVSFTIGGEGFSWSLGDYQAMLEETPGMETPKSGDLTQLRGYLNRKIFELILEQKIKEHGYRDSREMAEYLETREEEFVVDLVYDAEVQQKTVEPTGQEVKDYYRSHKEDYVTRPKVDVQQILVGTEAEANNLIQRLREGSATFDELVEKHSIDDWSKSKGGVIANYYQGEGRLSYLQEPAFSLDVGELSEPVRAPGGYAIVQILAKYPEEQQTFAEVGDSVGAALKTARREERLKEYIGELRETVTIAIIESNLAHVSDPTEVAQRRTQTTVTR